MAKVSVQVRTDWWNDFDPVWMKPTTHPRNGFSQELIPGRIFWRRMNWIMEWGLIHWRFIIDVATIISGCLFASTFPTLRPFPHGLASCWARLRAPTVKDLLAPAAGFSSAGVRVWRLLNKLETWSHCAEKSFVNCLDGTVGVDDLQHLMGNGTVSHNIKPAKSYQLICLGFTC